MIDEARSDWMNKRNKSAIFEHQCGNNSSFVNVNGRSMVTSRAHTPLDRSHSRIKSSVNQTSLNQTKSINQEGVRSLQKELIQSIEKGKSMNTAVRIKFYQDRIINQKQNKIDMKMKQEMRRAMLGQSASLPRSTNQSQYNNQSRTITPIKMRGGGVTNNNYQGTITPGDKSRN